MPSGRSAAWQWARASAFPGSAGPAASATTAAAAARTCATRRASPATRSTAATPNTRSRTQRYCLPLPDALDDAHAAPLLCAGLIGHRALRAAGPGKRLGLYGFGAAAHLIAQIALHEGREIAAFTRPGDQAAADFARALGVQWAGPSTGPPPWPLDAAIIFAPVGALVPTALRAVRKGGRVVCAGIHMSPIPEFPYEWLWGERELVSVANLTRADGVEFMRLAATLPLRIEVTPYALGDAQRALDDLRAGRLQGAAVLQP